jgi:N-acyl homoserine lactone hydrolase
MAATMDTATASSRLAAASRVSVHAIQTGSVRIRANQVRGKGHRALRLLRTYTGVAWSDWLPIYAWVIEHPEGLIVVDTGETARVSDPGYFPRWHPYFRRGLQERVTLEEEIGPQLENSWLDSRQVRWVVLTHLHTDHAGGLHHFPHSEILIDPREYAAASGLKGRLRGFLPNRLPSWLRPRFIDFAPMAFGPFQQSLPLTAGDTSYNQALMLEGAVDGVAPDEAAARDTLRRIRALAQQEPLVYLPAHDPASAKRLLAKQTVAFPA